MFLPTVALLLPPFGKSNAFRDRSNAFSCRSNASAKSGARPQKNGVQNAKRTHRKKYNKC